MKKKSYAWMAFLVLLATVLACTSPLGNGGRQIEMDYTDGPKSMISLLAYGQRMKWES